MYSIFNYEKVNIVLNDDLVPTGNRPPDDRLLLNIIHMVSYAFGTDCTTVNINFLQGNSSRNHMYMHSMSECCV